MGACLDQSLVLWRERGHGSPECGRVVMTRCTYTIHVVVISNSRDMDRRAVVHRRVSGSCMRADGIALPLSFCFRPRPRATCEHTTIDPPYISRHHQRGAQAESPGPSVVGLLILGVSRQPEGEAVEGQGQGQEAREGGDGSGQCEQGCGCRSVQIHGCCT